MSNIKTHTGTIITKDDEKPAIGQRTGKNDKTHWIIFVKD